MHIVLLLLNYTLNSYIGMLASILGKRKMLHLLCVIFCVLLNHQITTVYGQLAGE